MMTINYLSDKRQQSSINIVVAESLLLNSSVPQGSILCLIVLC